MIDTSVLKNYIQQLDEHPVYAAVEDLEDLRIFMQHHVYSVWDFMSLIKFLQNQIAPTTYPWLPRGSGDVRRFINELVLEEESDETHIDGEYSSHFELYQRAMREVGASTEAIAEFTEALEHKSIDTVLAEVTIPSASATFTGITFDFIKGGKPHEVAALLALGREHIIPTIFRSILAKMGIGEDKAPIFHFYLNRHIHLDEDFHAPLSLKMLNAFIDGDPEKHAEALQAADKAVQARLAFWDGVHKAIMNDRQTR